MSRIGVSVKIDVTKIDKARLFRGAKGTYLDTTVFIDLDEADQYGNHGMITQDVSKDERQSGVRGGILGNVKVFYKESPQAPAQAPSYQDAQAEYAKGQGQAQGPQQAAPQAQPSPPRPTGAPDPSEYNDFDDDLPF